MRSVSAILQVVASVAALDRRAWNTTCLLEVMFTTPWSSSSAALFIWASDWGNVLLGQVSLVLTSWNSCCSWCWNEWWKSLHLTGVIWWISRSNHSIARSQSASDHLDAACCTLFRRTWNCLHFDVVTFSALYTRTSIAAQILWMFCACNWWKSLVNSSFTLAFADFDIFWSWKALFFMSTHFCASSSAVRDRFEWFCWLTSRENSHNACTAPNTISSKAVSAGVLLSSLEQSRIGAQFTASDLIMPRIA